MTSDTDCIDATEDAPSRAWRVSALGILGAALFFLAINLVLGSGASALERRFATQRA